ncbi:MAG: ATP-binding cassette domain-containing protein [Pseudomonadales bacterium]|nr:ATP-binding cassette domain-containing protein [Pseudomonadales bacterium]NRA16142.1 ATP-binding cassette domain-containing protein [Oceanospirillaceae bacterium]
MTKIKPVVFQLQKLQLRLAGVAVFPEISIQLTAGELLVVMGPSGCGKSSLLAAIAGSSGDEFELSGNIVLRNQQLNGLSMERRGVAIQYQDDLLFPHLDVAGNLLFALPRGVSQERMHKVGQALESAGLAGFEKRDVATLSGGQRARVSLLRSLLARPKLLLLDEPFSRLDQALRQDFRQFVFAQIAAMNIPAILVSHDRQDCPNDQFYALSEAQMQILKRD